MRGTHGWRLAGYLALGLATLGSGRLSGPVGQVAARRPTDPPAYPFAVGESLHYTATLGYLPIGNAELTVPRVVKVRDADSFVLNLVAQGGPPGFAVKYQLTSWVGTRQFTSRRFDRIITQNGTVERHRFEIVGDSGRYREDGVPGDFTSPRDPLDELALLYYLRFAPLKLGQQLQLSRHFQSNVNPIAVAVRVRETVTLTSGEKLPCLALDVTFLGHVTQVWLSDDARRIPVQFAVPLPYGSVTLLLAGLPKS
jgi:hypothetical protein